MMSVFTEELMSNDLRLVARVLRQHQRHTARVVEQRGHSHCLIRFAAVHLVADQLAIRWQRGQAVEHQHRRLCSVRVEGIGLHSTIGRIGAEHDGGISALAQLHDRQEQQAAAAAAMSHFLAEPAKQARRQDLALGSAFRLVTAQLVDALLNLAVEEVRVRNLDLALEALMQGGA